MSLSSEYKLWLLSINVGQSYYTKYLNVSSCYCFFIINLCAKFAIWSHYTEMPFSFRILKLAFQFFQKNHTNCNHLNTVCLVCLDIFLKLVLNSRELWFLRIFFGRFAPALAWMAGIYHSNLSDLDNIAPLCIIFSKLRVGINTPIFSFWARIPTPSRSLRDGVGILARRLRDGVKNT